MIDTDPWENNRNAMYQDLAVLPAILLMALMLIWKGSVLAGLAWWLVFAPFLAARIWHVTHQDEIFPAETRDTP